MAIGSTQTRPITPRIILSLQTRNTLENADINNDRRVSRDEGRNANIEEGWFNMLDRMDSNEDGFITIDNLTFILENEQPREREEEKGWFEAAGDLIDEIKSWF